MRRSGTSVRFRLTALYSGLFVVTGLGLLAITYLLVQHAVSGGRSEPIKVVTTINGPVVGGPVLPEEAGPVVPPDVTRQVQRLIDQHTQQLLQDLLANSAIALVCMALLSIGLGWLVAGRILRPLRTMTATVQEISHTNLHQRLAADGPEDEIKELSDTFDDLMSRLEASFEAQRRFVANASHELRTPLARQRVIAQVAVGDPEATVESLRAAHDRVLASGAEQEAILEALLALARGQRPVAQAESVDLGVLAGELLAEDRFETDRGISVTPRLDSARVLGDARQLTRLVSNLIENAVVHNVDGGSVEIVTSQSGEHSVLRISNTGPEVPAEEIGRLLEPFSRLGTDRTNHQNGLGLGLSIVAEVAASHGAALDVRPRPGGGLDVEVRFPVVR